jgi:multidrug efflux pump subunit AcrB
LILGTLFRSYAQPFVIMFIIPFGAMGMVLGHMIMGRSIGIMSLIGLLALSGVVVNDSLIFVDFVNAKVREGTSMVKALMGAGRVRFRPILLTSITTMLGLSPLAFFATGQARFLQPMAITMFFGLAFATSLVLLLVPCTYGLLSDLRALLRAPRAFIQRVFDGSTLHPEEGLSDDGH